MLKIIFAYFFSLTNILTREESQGNQYTVEIYSFHIANLCSLFKHQKFVVTYLYG